jgi:hypothetical protein
MKPYSEDVSIVEITNYNHHPGYSSVFVRQSREKDR